jgi:cytochrome c biogenesis protein CcmG/thiol:disulfide interchange protein DsbE
VPRSLRLTAQTLSVALVAGLLALLIWKVVHGNGNSAASEISRGKTPHAPAFTLPRLDANGKLSLASLRGKGVLLNFWASWCVPCKQEAKELEKVQRRYAKHGLVVVGVDEEDFSGDARKFAHHYGLTYPLVHDGPGNLRGAYGLTGYPETFFVDRRGRLVGVHIAGPITDPNAQHSLALGLRGALAS